MEGPPEDAGRRQRPEDGGTPQAACAAARASLERVCALLIEPTPKHLDQSAELLAQAVERLAICRVPAPGPVPAAGPARHTQDLRQLRAVVIRARRLLEAAAHFHAGWVRCAGALCAGYTRSGQPGALEHASRVWAQG